MKSTALFKSILPAFLLLLSSTASPAGTIAPALSAKLQSGPSDDLVPVIVQFSDRTRLEPFRQRADRRAAHAELVRNLKATAEKSQGPLKTFLRKQGFKTRDLWIRNAVATEVPAGVVPALSDMQGVDELLLDAEISPPAPQPMAAPSLAPTWNLNAIGAPAAWTAGYTGSGSIVAIIDSGVDRQHPDLVTNWKGNPGGWFNPLAADCGPTGCTSCDSETSTPCDFLDGAGLAHGTSVASLITGRDASGTASIGVAPDAKWIAAKIFGEGIIPNNSHIIAALQWALDPTGNPADVPDVVNASWGFENNPDECLTFFQSEIRTLQAAGIHVVFAAGNTGPNLYTSVSPANLPEGLAVGAVDQTLDVSVNSARGPSACSGSIYTDLSSDVYPEVVAPGVGVLVANMPNSYATVGGTSFSAPHVSGALALLRGGINSSRLQIEEVLLTSSSDLGPGGADNSYGRGLIDIPAAILELSIPPVPILFAPADGATGVVTTPTFTWRQEPDPNGDPLTSTLVLSTDPGFGSETRFPVAMQLFSGSVLVAGLLLWPCAVSRKRLGLRLMIVALVLPLFSCGGGGGGDAPVPLTPNMSYTIDSATPLDPQTTYYWKIEVSDPDGNRVESATRSFTTE